MPNVRTLQKSFAGGEVSPELFGRIDDSKYESGLALCQNFISKPQGPAVNRPGFMYVNQVKNSGTATRLIPFTYSTTQTVIIELGAGYFRFHTQGATVLYSAPSAYVPSATVTITIASPGVITWTGHGLAAGSTVSFATTGALPTGITAGKTYYVINPATNTFQISATSGGTAINTSGTQSGTHTGSVAYTQGNLVSLSGTNYYCVTANSNQAPPNATYWYALPGSLIYEIPNSYAAADLFDIHYVQSADVLTLVHPGYPPVELRRYGASDWRLTSISFAAPISAPSAPSITVNVPSGATLSNAQTFTYVVTAIAADGFTESSASASGSASSNVYQTGVTNTISWTAVSGATMYNVYKLQGGLYGYIGQTSGTSIVDNNIAADMSKTPPIYDTVFNSAGNYPSTVSYFEQRRVFASTTSQLQNVWMTKSGTESVMSYCLPLRDDDRIAFKIAAREANTIRHLVPLAQLILLTSGGEWRVTSTTQDALTPTSVSVKPQSFIGASNIQPLVINTNVLYPAARGGHVREMAYSWQSNGFVTGDLSLRATHLFDNLSILDMAYSKAPTPIVWMVSSNGNLLGFTYIPDQSVGAWHQHTTSNGTFESCAVVAEGNEDFLYCVIKRTINGSTVRYIERMASRQFATQADAFFVDCGGTYNGPATTTISGLTWLEGQTVNVLADGAVHPQCVVTGGSITLQQPSSKVQIGIPITANVQTLPIAAQIDSSFGQGRMKNVNRAWLRVFNSGGIFIGPDANNLTEAKQRTTEPYGSPPSLKTGEIPIVVTPSWGDSGQIYVRQSAPLPLTLVSLTLEVALGA